MSWIIWPHMLSIKLHIVMETATDKETVAQESRWWVCPVTLQQFISLYLQSFFFVSFQLQNLLVCRGIKWRLGAQFWYKTFFFSLSFHSPQIRISPLHCTEMSCRWVCGGGKRQVWGECLLEHRQWRSILRQQLLDIFSGLSSLFRTEDTPRGGCKESTETFSSFFTAAHKVLPSL